jgi:hypothetical protein
MYKVHLLCREEPLGNTTLIGHDDYQKPGSVKHAYCVACCGEKVHLLPPCHILAFRRFTVDHSVSIEKGGLFHEFTLALPLCEMAVTANRSCIPRYGLSH